MTIRRGKTVWFPGGFGVYMPPENETEEERVAEEKRAIRIQDGMEMTGKQLVAVPPRKRKA